MPDQSVSTEGGDSLPADKRLSCVSVSSSTNTSCIFCVDDNVSLEISQSGVQDLEFDDTSRTKLESLCDMHKHLSHESETSQLTTAEVSTASSNDDSPSTGLINRIEVLNESTTKANVNGETEHLATNIITTKDSSVVCTLDSDQFVPSAEALLNNALENDEIRDQVKCQLINESAVTAEPNINLNVEKEKCADECISVNATIECDGNLASVEKDGAHFNEISDEIEIKSGDLQSCKASENRTTPNQDSATDITLSGDLQSCKASENRTTPNQDSATDITLSGDLQSCKASENRTTPNQDSATDITLSDNIEPNTKWTDDQLEKINHIESLLTKSVLDLSTLQELAAQKDGFVSDSIRRRVWPRLLHLQDATPIPLLSREESEKHESYTQVVLDVERTLKRFPPGISHDKRRVLMDQLIRVILTVMTRNPDMHYYQGYHDVGITLLLVCGHQAAPLLLEELSLTHLREFLQPTMERTQRWLAFLFPMLADTCPALHQHMMKASVGAVFCLAWLITWYAHTLSQYRQVVRLYDFLLASPPLMPMYVAAEILRHREQELLLVECDMAMLHHAMSQVPDDLPLDQLLQKARLLYRRLPPPSLADQVDQYLLEEKQREQVEREERERRMRAARRPAPPRSSWVARVWALASPRRLYGVHGAAAIAVLAMATAVYLRSYGAPRMLQW